MHGISIAQTKLQTLILKLVLKLKGRYGVFFQANKQGRTHELVTKHLFMGEKLFQQHYIDKKN